MHHQLLGCCCVRRWLLFLVRDLTCFSDCLHDPDAYFDSADLPCVCSSSAFQAAAGACIQATCSAADYQTALELQKLECSLSTSTFCIRISFIANNDRNSGLQARLCFQVRLNERWLATRRRIFGHDRVEGAISCIKTVDQPCIITFHNRNSSSYLTS